MFQLPKLRLRRVASEETDEQKSSHPDRPTYRRFPQWEAAPQSRFLLALDRALWSGCDSYEDSNGSGRSYRFSGNEGIHAYQKKSNWDNRTVFRTVHYPALPPARTFGVIIVDKLEVVTNLQPERAYIGADSVMSTFLESDEEIKGLNISKRVVSSDEIAKFD